MSDYQKKVEQAPYHPGYEDAVIIPERVYKGVDPAKMLWKQKPLSDEEIMKITEPMFVLGDKKMICNFARAIEEAHGIK